MKKRIALFLTMIFLVQALAGCGGTSAKEEETNTPVQNTGKNEAISSSDEYLSWEEIKAKIPESLKGTTVKVFSWNEMNAVPGAAIAVDTFTKETGINVEWTVGAYEEYATKIAAMVAADESPDIVRLRDADPAVMKFLTPLDEVNYDFTDQAWNQELMYHYQVNGKQYAAILRDTPFFQPMVTYYNRNLISKYNLEDPYTLWKNGEWTWSKCMEMCDTFLAAAGNQYQGMGMYSGSDYSYSLGTSFISYDPASNQYVSHMEDTNLIKGWQFTTNNISKGLVSPKEYQVLNFNRGLLLFCNDSLINARSTHFRFADLLSQSAVGVVPVPAVDGQETYYQMMNENEAYGIPQGSKNSEAAAYFLRFFLDSENYNMDSFYCDDRAWEVGEWCKKQKFITTMEEKIYEELYGKSRAAMTASLRESSAAQVKSILDSFSPVIDVMVTEGNKVLAIMKK